MADGRKRLHAQLMGYGGPQRWAAELGVPLVRRHSGPQHNDVEIRDSLRALLREHRPQRFPSDRWLREHGPPDLAPRSPTPAAVSAGQANLASPARGHRDGQTS
ncbi:MAG TPA: hypothetical protein VF526_22230 [Solirubrobacteraceae bacterium]